MYNSLLASLLKVCKWGIFLLAFLAVMLFSYKAEFVIHGSKLVFKLEPLPDKD